MRRFYSVSFTGAALTGATDLFELVPANGTNIRLHEISFGQSSDYGDAQAEGIIVSLKRAAGTYTAGSGGSAATPVPLISGNADAHTVVTTGNTTQASAGSGTLVTLRSEVFNVQSGYRYRPSDYLPSDVNLITCASGEALIVSVSAPADSLTYHGTLVFEERTNT